MPLTTRFLFEVMPESKINPCLIDKFGFHSDQNPHPLKIHKGCGTQSQKQIKIKNKSETSQNKVKITDKSTQGQ